MKISIIRLKLELLDYLLDIYQILLQKIVCKSRQLLDVKIRNKLVEIQQLASDKPKISIELDTNQYIKKIVFCKIRANWTKLTNSLKYMVHIVAHRAIQGIPKDLLRVVCQSNEVGILLIVARLENCVQSVLAKGVRGSSMKKDHPRM